MSIQPSATSGEEDGQVYTVILENATVLGEQTRVLRTQFYIILSNDGAGNVWMLHIYICTAEYHTGWIFRYT